MNIQQARQILMDNRPDRPRSLKMKQLQAAIDVVLKDQNEVIAEALREMRTER